MTDLDKAQVKVKSKALPSVQHITRDQADKWQSDVVSAGGLVLNLVITREDIMRMFSVGETVASIRIELPNERGKPINGVMTSY